MIDVLELCSLLYGYFIVLSVQVQLYSHLYYHLSSIVKCGTLVQRHDVFACHYFETWGEIEILVLPETWQIILYMFGKFGENK